MNTIKFPKSTKMLCSDVAQGAAVPEHSQFYFVAQVEMTSDGFVARITSPDRNEGEPMMCRYDDGAYVDDEGRRIAIYAPVIPRADEDITRPFEHRIFVMQRRMDSALDYVLKYGETTGVHKQWMLDQMIRLIADDNYEEWVHEYNLYSDTPWSTGSEP